MQCPQCQHENRDTAKFCETCGNSLALRCPSCDNEARPEAMFCDQCGTRLGNPIPASADTLPITQGGLSSTAPSFSEAERRQLTVMFCDLVESTALSGQLDPEELRDIVQAYQAACTEVIQLYGGHVAQLLGDGLLVYFGYPLAHEDDAQRSIRAGLGMLEAMSTLNEHLERSYHVQLAIRVGIHTGLVVVGDMGGEGRQEQLALGETPNIAARVQGVADPGTVRASDATYRLAKEYFTFEALGEPPLRGVAQPVSMYRVIQERTAQNRIDIATGLTPLIGRESESTLLFERWEQAKDGHGQVVLLSGEAGIGKSRLIQVVKDHVADETQSRLECRSLPYFANSTLYPIVDLLQRILQFREDHTETEKIQRLETSLEQYRLPLHESMPLFASLLSLPLPENRYPHLTLSPQHQRQKTLESLVAILLEQAERQPVLFIIEDLHWLDPTTLEFTDLLIDQTPTACVFVLLTCRPEFQPTWSHRSYLMEMTLNRLPRHQIARMAEQVAGGKGLPTEVVEQLADKTDGVPLYVEEMTKALFESGHMKEVDEAYELTDSIGSLTIPVTLQDSLMSRLDRLVTAKAVAQYAAVIGRQFSYELLQAVSQLDTSTLQRELERLVEAELIYQRGLPPQATYMFKHALIRDAAYESLLRRRRQGYHRRIAEVLEERFLETTETQPELLAHHYAAAGLHPQSLTAWQQAGTQAMARSAYREAVSCFEQALESLAQLPAAPETQAGAMDLRFALRNALLPLSEHERILDHLDAAERLAETLNDDHQLGQIAYYRCIHFMALGHYDRAIVAGKHALTLAASNGDFHVQVVAQTNLGFVYNMIADYRQAMTYSRQAIKALSGPLVFEGFGQLLQPALVARSMLTFCYAETGEFRDGLATAAEALRVAEEITQPYGLVVACNTLGALHYHQGDLCQALPLLERSYQLCQDANILLQLPRAASFLGAAYARDGRIADAQPHVAYMVAYLAAGNQVVMLGHILTVLGEALLCMGRVEEADAMAQRLLEHAKIHEGSGHQVHALRLLAEVAAHRDRSEVSLAETHYQQALVLAVELGMRPLQAHCHRGLGTLYSQTGQAEQARTELSTAIRMYRDMEMTFWLPQVEAVLAAVNG